jgi:allophanate hydrolase subunit 2
VILGPQEDRFRKDGLATFLGAAWKVSAQNDRMGYRLEGPPVALRDGADVLTDPVIPGSVQVAGNGLPIAMMMDCQTTGGYAKIATIVGPDLRLLGQARAGDELRFAACGQAEAVAALRAERALLARIARSVRRGPEAERRRGR